MHKAYESIGRDLRRCIKDYPEVDPYLHLDELLSELRDQLKPICKDANNRQMEAGLRAEKVTP